LETILSKPKETLWHLEHLMMFHLTYLGHVYGILGPNGSGKSTTLGIVLNVVNKTSGEYSWFNGKMKPMKQKSR
jgi:ABC-type Mn2+/Zn2+ transport system ATPase subunit